MVNMPGPEPFRHENFDRFPNQLLATVTEQAFNLAIDQDDLASVITHDHATGARLHSQPKHSPRRFFLRHSRDAALSCRLIWMSNPRRRACCAMVAARLRTPFAEIMNIIVRGRPRT
jgi:hypothetical protein